MRTNESEITASWERRIEACRDKDIDRLMACYSPAIVYYDVIPPLRFAGFEEVRGNFLRWFGEYDGPIGLETRDATAAVSGDVAFAHMLHLDSGKRTNGLDLAIWVRSTVCFRRLADRWLITHEHVSLPINPENLQAWFGPEE
ncbi:YybH family protein [Amycolatopsis nigrescens]|uniref:YybH family protein n=1 Tax=Amycolatopsis nigrescens TaxID=381445 RepID=UPI00037EBF80|nr:nuclear transport factor 2 family protein [Amycolatopsis nigrescens]